MDNPEKTLYDLLVAQWPTAGDVAKAVIKIQRADYSFEPDEPTFNTLYVCVGNNGMRRQQQMDDLFDYNAAIDIVYWADSKDPEALATAKDTVWAGMEAAKKIIQDDTLRPSDFSSMYVATTMNLTPEIPLPQVVYQRLNVSIQFNWRPT